MKIIFINYFFCRLYPNIFFLFLTQNWEKFVYNFACRILQFIWTYSLNKFQILWLKVSYILFLRIIFFVTLFNHIFELLYPAFKFYILLHKRNLLLNLKITFYFQ